MSDKPLPWSRCILVGAALTVLLGGLVALRTGLTWDLARAAVENTALIALVVRAVSESRDRSATRLFRYFALALGILAANRLLFFALQRLASVTPA